MKPFFTIIKSDYLQRTRSYAFLITLCISFAVAYTFVPAPNASYSTININGFQGVYNSAWFGYVTAIMSSVFLSLIGFYLVNGTIKTDIDTKVGHIIAATPITNFRYLLSKTLSNFLVLFTIVFLIFIMSIILFFLYSNEYPFVLIDFIKPYVFVTLPSLFVIAVLAVLFEVIAGKYTVIQNIGFFFLFGFLMFSFVKNNNQFVFDLIGSKIVTNQMQLQVNEILQTDTLTTMNIGYVLKTNQKIEKFVFNGIQFPSLFIFSRFLWMLFSVSCLYFISKVFHRFNVADKSTIKKGKEAIHNSISTKEFDIDSAKKVATNYSILPLLKTELTLLFRKGKKWLWIVNVIGMGLLLIVPLDISHKMILPVLWFLQVSRLSDIASKEFTNNVHYFNFSSYKPVSRLLVSQIVASLLLLLSLALPLIVRLVLNTNFLDAFLIVLGSVFIVFLASVLSMLTKGKKLFEVLFFMITYANLNGVPFFDYFGGVQKNIVVILSITIFMMIITFGLRSYQLRSNGQN